jgi:short-subunit dehydrogenase
VLIARKASELEAAKSELHEINPKVTVLTQAMDISDEEAVRTLFGRIKAELGTVDVLVNNAGSGQETAPIKDANPVNFWHDFVSGIHYPEPLQSANG